MSTVLIACPKCGKELKLRDRSLLGKRGKCPSCEHRFVLEEPDEVELELATNTPAVGTSAQWVPDEAAAKSANGRRVAAPAAAAPSDVPAFEVPIATDPGVSPIRDLRKRNAKRRNVGIAVGGVLALGIAGIVYAFAAMSRTAPQSPAGKGPPQVNASFEAEKQRLRENTERAAALSPTRGQPIDLKYLPAGVRVAINLRPAELWKDQDQFKEFRYCLGPLAEWTETQVKERCLFEPQQIEELLIGLIYGAPGEPPHICGVVHLLEEPKRSELLVKFAAEPNRDYGYPVYIGKDTTYLISDETPKTFAFAPTKLNVAQEMADAVIGAMPTDAGVEELLTVTDRERHITVVFRPDDARRHAEAMVPPAMLPFFNQLLDWFNPEEVETVAWSIFLDPKRFHSDIALRNKNVVTPPILQREMKQKLEALPDEILTAVQMMEPKELGKRQVIGRFPAMTKALEMGTVNGIADRYVTMTTVLPERAAPNLALGALLAWDESTRTDFTKAPTSPTPAGGTPQATTIAARLKKEIEIDFRRSPLQDAIQYIADETKVTIEIDGDALKLSGYTKNMPQTMNLGKVPATKALHEIIKQYGDMTFVVDEKKNVATLLTKAVAEKNGQKPFPLP